MRTPVTPEGHLSRHRLAQLQTGELSGDDASQAQDHAAQCERCGAIIAALRADDAAFMTLRPPGAFLASLEARRPPARRAWWPRLIAPVLAAAAAGAAALVLSTPPTALPPTATSPTTRLKGAVELSFHVKTGDAVRRGGPDERVTPGDAIQLRYSTPSHTHLVVVSLDSKGAVTPFYEDSGRSLAITPGTAELLDGSVVLDGALGPERVIGCFSTRAVPTSAAVQAGQRALAAAGGDPVAVERLDLPCTQASFVLRKEAAGP